MRTLNRKLLLALVGATALATVGAVVAHYYQSGPISRALLWQARRAEEAENPRQAADYLKRYLEFQPHDTEERAHLGRLLAADPSPRTREGALFVLEPVLAREPERHDLRRVVVRLAMELKPPRLEKAREHLTVLQKAFPEDGEIIQLLGECCEADREDPQGPEKASQYYRQAIRKAPTRIESYERLARLLRGPLAQLKEADEVVQQMVQANGDSFRAYLVRARYRLAHGVTEGVDGDLKRALELAPDEAEVLLAAADQARTHKTYDEARKYLRRGLDRHPSDARFYQALSRVEMLAGEPARAVEVLEQGAQVFSGRSQANVLWTLANLLLDQREWDKAEGVIGQVAKKGGAPAAVPYLQGRMALGKEEWAAAALQLERARHLLEGAPEENNELFIRIDLSLGHCYGQLHEPTRQLEAFQRVLKRDPRSEAGHLGTALALRTLGRLDAALQHYQDVTRRPQASAARWIEMARLGIEHNLLRNGGDWKSVEEALRKAEESAGRTPHESVDIVLLRAQLLAAQNHLPEARTLLEKARDRQPAQVPFHTALAELAARQGNWPEALALLDRAEQQLGDSVDLRLARARYWGNRRTLEAASELAKLEQGRERFSDDDQALLLQGLAEAYYRLGRVPEAEKAWAALADHPRHRKDIRLRLLLFDLAMREGQDAKMQEALRSIAAIEGGQGATARYAEALRLIWLAQQSQNAGRAKTEWEGGLDDARLLLDQVASQRPTWPALLLAKAEIDRLRGNPDQAIEYYRKAMTLGETGPRVIRPLVQLLYRCQRYAEAAQEMRRLQQQSLTDDLRLLGAEISLRTGDPARAAYLAMEAVSADSRDYADHLWLGQVLAASGRNLDEAEKRLQRAVELGETRPETWVALVQFLAARDRRPEAEAVMERARAKLPPADAPLGLAQCHEAMGRPDEALQQFQAALAGRPHDPVVLRNVAGFYMRCQRPKDAEPLLRRVVAGQVRASPAEVGWARRALAMVLAAGGSFRQFNEALALVGLRLDDAGQVAEDRPVPAEEATEEVRARARVLATRRVKAFRARAVGLLEGLSRRQPLATDDLVLLARLYEADKAWPRISRLLQPVIQSGEKSPPCWDLYAQSLLHQGDYDGAERCIRQLEAWEGDKQRGTMGSVDLRVAALMTQGRTQDALARMKSHVERPGAKPEEVIPLIGHLARANRLDDALRYCERCWQTCPPEMAGAASVALLRAGHPGEAEFARVEGWLRAAREKNPQSTALLLHLADFQDLRGRYPEAMELYRLVLARDPENVLALNNLAWLLALKMDQGDDARPLIDRALGVLGPRPELLDTSAVVYLAQRQPEKAIADLQKAAKLDAPTGARCFHLARAYQLAGNQAEARRAFRQARDLGLRRAQLHPVERIVCGKIFDELDRR